MVVVQYPDILTYSIQGTGIQDENGNWIVDGIDQEFELKCRAEPASGNGLIKNVDGTVINYSWIVYLPLPVEEIAVGTEVTIESKLKDTVKRFSRGQLNARIWL